MFPKIGVVPPKSSIKKHSFPIIFTIPFWRFWYPLSLVQHLTSTSFLMVFTQETQQSCPTPWGHLRQRCCHNSSRLTRRRKGSRRTAVADVEGPRGRLMRGSNWHPDWKLEGKMIGSSGWVLGSFTLMGLRVS